MIEILPIKLLTSEDASIFGSLNVSLGALSRAGLPVGSGIVITPPNLKLKTTLEHYDFKNKETFEQTLTLIQKEINLTPVPEVLITEIHKQKHFFVQGQQLKSVKDLWLALLYLWLDEIKNRLWNSGFYQGITEGLEPKVVIFNRKIESFGTAYFDPLQDDVVINTKSGKLHPKDLKKIADLVKLANKKLFIPHEYEWMLDREIKLIKVLLYTSFVIASPPPWRGAWQSSHFVEDLSLIARDDRRNTQDSKCKSAVKVFFDLSTGFTMEKNVDGVYIASEKLFNLDKPSESFEEMISKLMESATAYPQSPVLFKLADKSEGLPVGQAGMGKVRGALRLLHQKSLFNPLIEALDFARHKKGLTNIHVVIPFVRNISELLQIKRELAAKKLMRKNSFEIWMEAGVPENIINLEDYLLAGLDGVVLNLDELIAYLNGFDHLQEDLLFYKNEVDGLIKFLDSGVKLLHKSKIPFIAYGTLSLEPKVLEFLVEKGIYGIVADRSWAHSACDLLRLTEKRFLLKRSM